MTKHHISRRTFLKRTAGAALLVAGTSAGVLSACGSSKKETKGMLGVFRYQESWLQNVSSSAEFIAADRRVFENNGFESLQLIYGGPNIDGAQVLADRKADMAAIDSLTFLNAAEKDQLVCIGTRLARSPVCITSLPALPIRIPSDLVGKRIGVQKKYESIWSAFLKGNNVDEKKVTRVLVQNDPKPLQDNQVDGFFSWIMNQPVTLRTRNVPCVNMMFADFGFSLPEQCWVVPRQYIVDNRARVLAGLSAEVIAQQMFLRDYNAAADLTVNKYAKDSGDTPDYVRYYISEIRDVINSSDVVREKGIGYMESETIDRYVKTLAMAGITISPNYFDNSLLAEIYKDGPDLLKKYERKY